MHCYRGFLFIIEDTLFLSSIEPVVPLMPNVAHEALTSEMTGNV